MKISNLTSNQLLEYAESVPVTDHLWFMIHRQFTKRIIWVKDQRGRCSHCGTVHLVDKPFKAGDTKVCDGCWSMGTLVKLRKNSNFDRHSQGAFAKIIRRDNDTLIQTTYFMKMIPKPTGEEFIGSVEEHAFLQGKDLVHISKTYMYPKYELEWVKRKQHITYGSWSYYNWSTYYAHDDWDELLDGHPLKYSQIDKYIEHKGRHPDRLMQCLQILAKYPMLEMVWKAGMTSLYDDFMQDVKYKREAVSALKKYRKYLIGKNLSMQTIAKARLLAEKYGVAFDQAIEYASTQYHIFDEELLDDLVKIKPANDIIKYINKNSNIAFGLTTFRDYLNMMEKIGTPVNEDTIFPKDLKKAHDLATDKYNAIKHEKDNGQYSKRLKTLKSLEFVSDGLMIIVPRRLEEILREGRELSHCVGSYVQSVAKGETTILFVRKAEDPDQPYYTIEFKENKVRQLRGLKNQQPTDEIEQFVEHWEKIVTTKPTRKVNHVRNNSLVIAGA